MRACHSCRRAVATGGLQGSPLRPGPALAVVDPKLKASVDAGSNLAPRSLEPRLGSCARSRHSQALFLLRVLRCLFLQRGLGFGAFFCQTPRLQRCLDGLLCWSPGSGSRWRMKQNVDQYKIPSWAVAPRRTGNCGGSQRFANSQTATSTWYQAICKSSSSFFTCVVTVSKNEATRKSFTPLTSFGSLPGCV